MPPTAFQHAGGMNPTLSMVARLHDQPGVLRPLIPDDADLGADPAAWIWEGRLSPSTLAALLATALRGGTTPCLLDARPHVVTPRVCWYDAESGRVLLELLGPPEPVADA